MKQSKHYGYLLVKVLHKRRGQNYLVTDPSE